MDASRAALLGPIECSTFFGQLGSKRTLPHHVPDMVNWRWRHKMSKHSWEAMNVTVIMAAKEAA